MAFLQTMITDCNGFALFDLETLSRSVGRSLESGDNLLLEFKNSNLGDKVLDEGAIVPVYPITDGTYIVSIREFHEAKPDFADTKPYARSGVFPFCATRNIVVADLAVLQEWWPEEGWQRIDLNPGTYAVDVTAYVGEDISGFEIVLSKTRTLPRRTADWGVDLDVGNPKRP